MRTFLPFIIIIVLLACSGTENTLDTDTADSSTNKQDIQENTADQDPGLSGYNISQYQSSLSDTYTYKTNDIPEPFKRLKIEEQEEDDERDLFEGYRVQIYSGQDVALADTIAMQFRAWSDTTITGYQADTYTFFRSPYYRVHVGDFHDRDRAIYYSNLLKRRFRDSWVVYDRVNPWNVPSDTTDIYIE